MNPISSGEKDYATQKENARKWYERTYPEKAKASKKRQPSPTEPLSGKKRRVSAGKSATQSNEGNSEAVELDESSFSTRRRTASPRKLVKTDENRRRKSSRGISSNIENSTTDSSIPKGNGPFTTAGLEATKIRGADQINSASSSSSSSSSSSLSSSIWKSARSSPTVVKSELKALNNVRVDSGPSQGLNTSAPGPFISSITSERKVTDNDEVLDSNPCVGLYTYAPGPFSSTITTERNDGVSDSMEGYTSKLRKLDSLNISTPTKAAPLRPARRSVRPARRVSQERATEDSSYVDNVVDNHTHSTDAAAFEGAAFEAAALVTPVPFSEAEIAVEFARKSSAVMPTLPAGTLPLLSAMVFFIGVGLMAYMGLCHGHEECMDPSFMLTSLGHVEGEGASEFFERARLRVAPTADYVVEQLKQMWDKICAGELSQLSQLLTDKDIRVAVLMYLGAVIALCGLYFTITTMDCGNTFSNSYARLVSSLKTSERLASVTERFEANSVAFTQWREATRTLVFGDDEDSSTAPTPPFSLSAFCSLSARAFRWVVRGLGGIGGEKTTPSKEPEIVSTDGSRKTANDRDVTIIRPPMMVFTGSNTASEGEASSLSTSRLRNQFSVFHRAKKPQILSFLQRLDVTAAILATLFLLLVLFLYHKTIKHFLSYCMVPCAMSVAAFSAGRAAQLSYRWVKDRAALRKRQIAVSVSFTKDHLIRVRGGGPYPVDFIFEELKDLLADCTVESLTGAMAAPAITRATFGKPGYLSPSSSRERDNEKNNYQEVNVEIFKALWKDIIKEVLQDHRLLSIVMIFEGARRVCWKSLGAKNFPTPSKVPDPAPVPAFIPTPKKMVMPQGVTGWLYFTFQIVYWVLSGSFRGTVFLIRFITRWM